MDYNEFNTILKNEKLNNICFDENNLLCNTVYQHFFDLASRNI